MPITRPIRAHSLAVIFNLAAATILGIFPGMSIPPAIKRPRRALFIWIKDKDGPISAAVKVALSTIAEVILTQYNPYGGI